jgi:hypothetical protein
MILGAMLVGFGATTLLKGVQLLAARASGQAAHLLALEMALVAVTVGAAAVVVGAACARRALISRS